VASAADIVRAREPFDVTLANGVPVGVRTGDLFSADDPIVKGREHLFGEVTVRSSLDYGRSRVDVDTETADAAPGTRRAPVRRRSVDTPPPKGVDERPADAQPAAGLPDVPEKDRRPADAKLATGKG
jgi:hypothetical protein